MVEGDRERVEGERGWLGWLGFSTFVALPVQPCWDGSLALKYHTSSLPFPCGSEEREAKKWQGCFHERNVIIIQKFMLVGDAPDCWGLGSLLCLY
jgi:hypothetical protein